MSKPSIYRQLLAVLFLLMGAQTLQAQEAFYIYRNDGDFDGFFFDRVIRMGYSKTDLEGKEHDIFVVQEVETADSLYRIPLAAIDSIGFVQPEIRFNPRLKNLSGTRAEHFAAPAMGAPRKASDEGERMCDWIREIDGMFLYFDLNTPKDLIPEVGDVLVDFYNPMFKRWGSEDEDYSGFSGKVTHSWESYNYWVVRLDPLESLSDVFEQFITTEEVSQDEEGHAKRRLAGWHPELAPAHVQGGGAVTLLDLSNTLKHDFKVGENGTIGVSLGIDLTMKLAATYNITTSNMFIKTIMTEDFNLKGAVEGKFDGEAEYELEGLPKLLSSIKFPAAAPLLQTRPLPKGFLRIKGEMGTKVELPPVGFRARQSIVIDSDVEPMMSHSCTVEGPEGEPQKSILEGTDVSLFMNASVQTGVKLSANIETNDWIEDLFLWGCYADFYIGPQVEGSLKAKSSLGQLLSGDPSGIYSTMRGSSISLAALAANVEVKGQLNLLGESDASTFMELNRKWMEKTWYLFPDLRGSVASYNSATGEVEGYIRATGSVFVPSHLGAAIYKKDDSGYQQTLIDKSFSNFNYFLNEDAFNEYKFTFSGLPCGTYYVQPILQTLGVEIPVDDTSAERKIVVTPILQLGNDEKRDSINVAKEGKELTYYIRTNNPWTKAVIETKEGDGIWMQASIEDFDEDLQSAKLSVTVTPNTSFWDRLGDVILISKTQDYMSTDTLRVHQEVGARTIKHAAVRITHGGQTRDKHMWGDNKGQSYNENNTYNDPGGTQTYAITEKEFTCNLADSMLYCSGTYYDDVSGKTKGSNDYFGTLWKEYEYNQNGGYTYDISFVIDLRKKPASIVGGSFSYKKDVSRNDKDIEYYVGGDEKGRVRETVTTVSTSAFENSGSWKDIIPYASSTYLPEEFKDVEHTNQMWFRLEGTKALTLSGTAQERATTTDTWHERDGSSSTTTSHAYSETNIHDFILGEDSAIDVFITF